MTTDEFKALLERKLVKSLADVRDKNSSYERGFEDGVDEALSIVLETIVEYNLDPDFKP